jgi:hypothetical protein
VEVVDAALATVLGRDADTLRDRRVFPHGVVQARRVSIDGPSGEILVEDARDGWRLVVPREGRVDTDALVALLKTLHALRVVSYVARPLVGAGETGLAKPTLTCTLQTWDEERTTLRVGGAVEANPRRVYADSTGQTGLLALQRSDLQGLYVRADELLEQQPAAEGEAKPERETRVDEE